jgi:PAS domain S-box-containing protein
MMQSFGHRLRRHARDFWISWLVLVIGVALTLMSAGWTRQQVRHRQQTAFEEAKAQILHTVELYFSAYYNILNGLKSAFARDELITAKEFKDFLEAFGLRQNHVGIYDVGFVQRVRPQDRTEFIRRVKSIDSEVQTPVFSPDRAVDYALIYWDDFARPDLGVPGLNQLNDPPRAAAMDKAIDTGEVACTEKLDVWVGAEKTLPHGFILYAPVYRNGARIETAAERREAAVGLVYASFLARDCWREIYDRAGAPPVDLEVYDGVERRQDRLWFDSDGVSRGLPRPAGHTSPSFETILARGGLGREWTFYFASLPAFESALETRLPLLVLLGGLAVTIALSGLSLAQARSRRHAELLAARLQASNAQVEAQKERLAVTLSAVDDGVMVTDGQGSVAFMNRAAEQLTGGDEVRWSGKAIAELLEIADPQSGEVLPCPLGQVLQTGETFCPSKPISLRAKGHAPHLAAVTVAALRDATGATLGAVVVFRDVTERQRLIEEQMKSSKLESVGLLAGGIAHDFNNILTAIVGNLSLAQMEAGTTGELPAVLREAELACGRARELTQQLLTFSKGGAPIRQTALLGDVIAESCRFATHGSNVRCLCDLPADLWPVEADKGQISQVIQNIVLNAVEAMPEGGVVEVQARNAGLEATDAAGLPAGRYVAIAILDHGTGIRPEHLGKVFDPYFSTKQRGSGLGLATAYSIVKRHDGMLRVESTLGSGSRFEILLPASDKASTPAAPAASAPVTGSGLILVMDDERPVLTALQRMLERLGYAVVTASDGAEAVRLYEDLRRQGQSVSAVILDLTVPAGMGGLATVRRLHELDPHVRALVSSGYSNDPVLANHRHYGFRAVVPKPYGVEVLGRTLRDVLAEAN